MTDGATIGMSGASSRRAFLAGAAGAMAAALLPRAVAAATATSSLAWPSPPAAKRIPTRIGRFGHSRIDDYAWLRPKDWFAVLRDPSTLEAPIRAQIDAENAYTEAMLAPAQPLQGELQAHIERLAALVPAAAADEAPLPAGIEAGPGQYAATPDGRYLFWVRRAEGGPATVLRRDVAAGSDVAVHEEADPISFELTLRTTAAGGYVVIRSAGIDSSEVSLVPTQAPTAEPLLVEPRTPGLRYDVDEWDGRLLILTDADGAEDFKLVAATPEQPGRAHWQPLLPHRPGRLIAAVHPFADCVVREEWRDGLPRLTLMRRDGSERELVFDEPAYALNVPPGQGGDAAFLAFTWQSPRKPPRQYRLDLASGRHEPVAAASAFDSERYEVRRIAARADDGEEVPITVLMRAGQKLDGSAPLFLHGYGSYGWPVDAGFDPARLALVERGWIVAIAHVRGGCERGTRWWRSVLRTGKKRSFTDFIACAEHLAAERYTARGRIVAFGLSAGGLLAGAVYTMRPDLWAGVVAPVAFVDVLTTLEYYEDHPLGASGIPIWGDPRIPADHDYIASYSPYDQLRPAAYPALLVTGVVDDGDVSFWEPLKFATKARALTTAGNPILSLTGSHGGHLGPEGAFAAPALQARYLAFAIWAADKRWGEVPQRSTNGESA
ncbi:MAG: prolyl oligopeptidase family serine peptidase [Pseudoxanthomonas sp.]